MQFTCHTLYSSLGSLFTHFIQLDWMPPLLFTLEDMTLLINCQKTASTSTQSPIGLGLDRSCCMGVIFGILNISAFVWTEQNWKRCSDENWDSFGKPQGSPVDQFQTEEFREDGEHSQTVCRALKYFKVEAIGNKLAHFVSGTKTLYVTCSHNITNWCVGGGAASGQSWQFEAISLRVLTKDSAPFHHLSNTLHNR